MVGAQDVIEAVVSTCSNMINDSAGYEGVIQAARASFVGSNIGVKSVFDCNDVVEADVE